MAYKTKRHKVHTAKFDRLVADLKRKGEVSNPYAVATAKLGKKAFRKKKSSIYGYYGEPYKIPRTKRKTETEQPCPIQSALNYYLFSEKKGETEPKLLTIIVRKDKEHFFHFLKNETEFEVQGKWHDKAHKVFKEDNAEIEIIFHDNKQGSVGKKIQSLLKEYNRKRVKEQVLYTTITPLDSSSIA